MHEAQVAKRFDATEGIVSVESGTETEKIKFSSYQIRPVKKCYLFIIANKDSVPLAKA